MTVVSDLRILLKQTPFPPVRFDIGRSGSAFPANYSQSEDLEGTLRHVFISAVFQLLDRQCLLCHRSRLSLQLDKHNFRSSTWRRVRPRGWQWQQLALFRHLWLPRREHLRRTIRLQHE